MIERFHQRKDAETALTLGAHMEKLRELRDHAVANHKFAAAVRAEYLRGKAAGLYDNVEYGVADEFSRMSTEELRQAILDQDEVLRSLGIEMTVSTPTTRTKQKR
jgi:hypothetical protein